VLNNLVASAAIRSAVVVPPMWSVHNSRFEQHDLLLFVPAKDAKAEAQLYIRTDVKIDW